MPPSSRRSTCRWRSIEQLRKLAFDEEGKMHDYLLEGLDLVFRQRGLPGIAELKKKHP